MACEAQFPSFPAGAHGLTPTHRLQKILKLMASATPDRCFQQRSPGYRHLEKSNQGRAPCLKKVKLLGITQSACLDDLPRQAIDDHTKLMQQTMQMSMPQLFCASNKAIRLSWHLRLRLGQVLEALGHKGQVGRGFQDRPPSGNKDPGSRAVDVRKRSGDGGDSILQEGPAEAVWLIHVPVASYARIGWRSKASLALPRCRSNHRMRA